MALWSARWSARRFTGVAAVLVAVLAGAVATVAAGDGTPSEPHRHSSGLWVLPGVDDPPGVPAELDEQYSAYDTLGDAFPDDVGYVHVDSGKLVVDVASDSGEDLAGSMAAGRPLPVPARGVDPHGKLKAVLDAKGLAVRDKPVVLRRVERSRTAVERIADGVIDLADDPALADADIWQTAPEPVTGRVIVWMSQLTDAAASAIVGAYGTEAVAVIEESNPGLGADVGRPGGG